MLEKSNLCDVKGFGKIKSGPTILMKTPSQDDVILVVKNVFEVAGAFRVLLSRFKQHIKGDFWKKERGLAYLLINLKGDGWRLGRTSKEPRIQGF